MVMVVDPSGAKAGGPVKAMSATITPGMLNSASSSPSHMRSTIRRESGARIRSSSSCRSPLKVSERQSTENESLSKILFRATRARPVRHLSSAEAAGDMGSRFIGVLLQDRPQHARQLSVWDRGRFADRRQIADLPRLLVQTGSEACHFGARTFLLL